MGTSRKRYKSDYKAKIALEALREQKTLSELSGQYGLHPNQITDWKRIVKENAHCLFEKQNNSVKGKDELIERLYQQIGKFQVELDWLKKKV